TIGTVTMSGGVYNGYAAATDKITVYNIDQFTDSTAAAPQGIYIDANGNGDFADTVAGITETTKYYVCTSTATILGAGTIEISTNAACTAGVNLTANGIVDGWIVPASAKFVSKRAIVHDVEPAIT
ncbi:unnamed protein product, partial [marine sediment metagenome]